MNRLNLEAQIYRVLGTMPKSRPMVFGIGLAKTGTTSLNDALIDLGYKAYHLPPVAVLEDGELRFRPEWWTWKFDAWTDLSVAVFFEELAQTFPNARFIYTERERAKWLRSCERHFVPALVERRKAQGNEWILDLVRGTFGSDLYDEAVFNTVYDAHEAAVLKYFEGSDRFLRIDITAGHGWDSICPFLGKPEPSTPFPHSNLAANPA
ncbi:MAG: sulfotransferase family protein [Pseudomonadota bacterium]